MALLQSAWHTWLTQWPCHRMTPFQSRARASHSCIHAWPITRATLTCMCTQTTDCPNENQQWERTPTRRTPTKEIRTQEPGARPRHGTSCRCSIAGKKFVQAAAGNAGSREANGRCAGRSGAGHERSFTALRVVYKTSDTRPLHAHRTSAAALLSVASGLGGCLSPSG